MAWRFVLVAGALLAGIAAPVPAVERGEPAPSFRLAARDTTTVDLAELRGRVVLLDFWASWCAPCRRSLPWLDALAVRYRDRGLVVLAINTDRDRDAALRFLAAVPIALPVLWDDAGHTARAYALPGMPTSVLIGADGRVRAVYAGFREDGKSVIEADLIAALNSAAGTR